MSIKLIEAIYQRQKGALMLINQDGPLGFNHPKITIVVIISLLLLSWLLAGSGVFIAPIAQAASGVQSSKGPVITVPGGDVAALYNAVYDENGSPRNNVEINLEPGVFQLDPAQPFGGRLVLGEKTTLRSTLEMAVDANGVPMVDSNNDPIVLVEGAKIDGSLLPSAPLGEAEGLIIVRDKGVVEQLWVDSSQRPGVVITFKGTARKVASTRHIVGFQVQDVGSGTQATLEGNLAAGNVVIGMSLVSNERAFHPTGNNAEVRGNVHHSASINNGIVNFLVIGGTGATTNSKVAVEASQNIFRGAAILGNVRVVGGQNSVPFSGSNNNQVKVNLVNNEITDTGIGLKVEGGNLVNRPLPLAERQSSNNEVKINLSGNTFENNAVDIRVFGSWSQTAEPGGDNNTVKVVIEGSDPTALTTDIHDCFPEADFPTCTSEANVTFGNN
ncbi:MAG: hypothetical protein H6632_16970 [Anaerolineales bacterium]|nr:hypothetical protein [Anaerolineales bacterium]